MFSQGSSALPGRGEAHVEGTLLVLVVHGFGAAPGSGSEGLREGAVAGGTGDRAPRRRGYESGAAPLVGSPHGITSWSGGVALPPKGFGQEEREPVVHRHRVSGGDLRSVAVQASAVGYVSA